MKTKQQFIDAILASLDDVESAKANPFLYEKVAFRMKSKPKAVYISQAKVWLQAACIAGLLAFNVGVCAHFAHTKHTARQANAIRQEYFSYLNDDNYNI